MGSRRTKRTGIVAALAGYCDFFLRSLIAILALMASEYVRFTDPVATNIEKPALVQSTAIAVPAAARELPTQSVLPARIDYRQAAQVERFADSHIR